MRKQRAPAYSRRHSDRIRMSEASGYSCQSLSNIDYVPWTLICRRASQESPYKPVNEIVMREAVYRDTCQKEGLSWAPRSRAMVVVLT